jgi:hypothetical protein
MKRSRAALYTEDPAADAIDVIDVIDVIQRARVVSNARLLDAGATEQTRELTFEHDGTQYALQLAPIARGSHNMVYALSPGLIARVSVPPKNESEEETEQRVADHRVELRFMRRMGKLGIGPRVHAKIRFADPSMTGVVTERLEMSLYEAESCPHLTRAAFVDGDAESALVDLYARSSRVVRCHDTKSQNVMFSAEGPRIAMIDMDTMFCMDVKSEPSRTTKDAPATTIEDLRAWLAAPRDDDDPREAACISLLMHCVVSAVLPHETPRLYGFPYPRVAACLYRHWDAVWQMAFRKKQADTRYYTDAHMLGFYYNMRIEEEKYRTLHLDDAAKVKSTIASALRAPMTRALLMTRGLDVNDAIEIVQIGRDRVLSGDLYVRLARMRATSVDLDHEMNLALDSADSVQELEKLFDDSGFGIHVFQCRLSATKNEALCSHADQKDQKEQTYKRDQTDPVAVRYSARGSGKEKKWGDRAAVPGTTTLSELDRVQTARFLCDLITKCGPLGRPVGGPYYAARRIYKHKKWTGRDIVRLVGKGALTGELKSLGIPGPTALRLKEEIESHLYYRTPIEKFEPCH